MRFLCFLNMVSLSWFSCSQPYVRATLLFLYSSSSSPQPRSSFFPKILPRGAFFSWTTNQSLICSVETTFLSDRSFMIQRSSILSQYFLNSRAAHFFFWKKNICRAALFFFGKTNQSLICSINLKKRPYLGVLSCFNAQLYFDFLFSSTEPNRRGTPKFMSRCFAPFWLHSGLGPSGTQTEYIYSLRIASRMGVHTLGNSANSPAWNFPHKLHSNPRRRFELDLGHSFRVHFLNHQNWA